MFVNLKLYFKILLIIYVYLVNIDNNADMIFARLEGDEIVTLSDPLELEKVVNKVHDNLRENKE